MAKFKPGDKVRVRGQLYTGRGGQLDPYEDKAYIVAASDADDTAVVTDDEDGFVFITRTADISVYVNPRQEAIDKAAQVICRVYGPPRSHATVDLPKYTAVRLDDAGLLKYEGG